MGRECGNDLRDFFTRAGILHPQSRTADREGAGAIEDADWCVVHDCFTEEPTSTGPKRAAIRGLRTRSAPWFHQGVREFSRFRPTIIFITNIEITPMATCALTRRIFSMIPDLASRSPGLRARADLLSAEIWFVRTIWCGAGRTWKSPSGQKRPWPFFITSPMSYETPERLLMDTIHFRRNSCARIPALPRSS